MKFCNISFRLIRIIAGLILLFLIGVAIYLVVIMQRQSGKTESFCLTHNKEKVDAQIKETGITTFQSHIHCNTYYLDLNAVPVEALSGLGTVFNEDLKLVFTVHYPDYVIIGTLNEEGEIIYNQS